MKRGNKKAQLQISFGMIFSIILIIVFLAFTGYVITKFFGLQKGIIAGTFLNDLQSDVDKMWGGSQGSEVFEYNVPSKTEFVCFTDFSRLGKGDKQELYSTLKQSFFGSENLVFYPIGSAEGIDSKKIEHINITRITQIENPFCLSSVKGKVQMTIQISPGDNLVNILR